MNNDLSERLGLKTVFPAKELLLHKPEPVPFVAVPMWDDIAIEAQREGSPNEDH